MALAWIDISTGVFRLAETTPTRLLADIFRIDPREVIVPDNLMQDGRAEAGLRRMGRLVVPQPSVLFDSASARAG